MYIKQKNNMSTLVCIILFLLKEIIKILLIEIERTFEISIATPMGQSKLENVKSNNQGMFRLSIAGASQVQCDFVIKFLFICEIAVTTKKSVLTWE